MLALGVAALQNARMEIDVLIEDPAWTGLEAQAARVLPEVLSHLAMDTAAYEVSILGCDDARIATLNEEFRGKPVPTNVLSWPATTLAPPDLPPFGELGDIAIAHGVCRREAGDQGKSFEHHVAHLLVHATLHLLGYDHETDVEAAEMEGIEVAILARLGIADPY